MNEIYNSLMTQLNEEIYQMMTIIKKSSDLRIINYYIQKLREIQIKMI